MSSLRARWMRFAAVAALAVTLPACGYSLAGRANNLPSDWRIIGVPLFVNHSTVPDVEVALTDAVRVEFQSHARYKTVPEADGADAVITATVTSVRLRAIAFTASRQASRYAATVTAEVVFKDKAGKTWWQNRAAQFTEEYDVATSTAPNDPTNFFGQDRAALQRLARNFAQSIVTSILDSF